MSSPSLEFTRSMKETLNIHHQGKKPTKSPMTKKVSLKRLTFPLFPWRIKVHCEIRLYVPNKKPLNVELIDNRNRYPTIHRLTTDRDPRNTYIDSVYISTTGGGSGGLPMFFATDALENREHRKTIGTMIQKLGVIESGDLVLSMHTSGDFYRSLDLLTEIVENAGGSVLPGGIRMALHRVADSIAYYGVNALTGDGCQMLFIANYIASLPPEKRSQIKIDKVIYTSDPLIREQRDLIKSIFPGVKITSIVGSAEAGAWGVSNPEITGEPDDDGMDFIFDRRTMEIEILPMSIADAPLTSQMGLSNIVPTKALPDGETGIIVQTSLCRLRHPLLRYVTGDLGNLRPFPNSNNIGVPECEAQHFRILRLYGRDRRFSFEWAGEYFEFPKIKALLQSPGWGILQWQVVIGVVEFKERSMEVRLYRSNVKQISEAVSETVIIEQLEFFFVIHGGNQHLFRVVFLPDPSHFERSTTGFKVINFIDRGRN
ncbi:hypothetical protein DRE_04426 [Drechslerella stenobrocha 248]|uniref:AMP-dependent synthetase/ligase domain-containing protein n=1 Tax=Drechslerella stenobrocha 248 TaxID=1043628 RepID=W7IB06_9PEZI|nr:hypothetical protein DRE_04426 [Drechslerella stenobrocha 248]